MTLTMAAVAANKGIVDPELEVSVEARTEFVGRDVRTRFHSRVELGDGLTPREVRILYNAARSCEVHKMLRGEIEFEETLITEGVKR